MSAHGDTIVFPEVYTPVLMSRARYHFWQFKDNPQAAAFALEDYKKGLIEVGRILCPGGSFFISNDIVDGDTCGHGYGPLEKPEHIISILDQAGFINISMEKYYNEETGIYLISSKKP